MGEQLRSVQTGIHTAQKSPGRLWKSDSKRMIVLMRMIVAKWLRKNDFGRVPVELDERLRVKECLKKEEKCGRMVVAECIFVENDF